jgi:hypothetical protein
VDDTEQRRAGGVAKDRKLAGRGQRDLERRTMADEPVTVRISQNRARRRYEAYVGDVLAAYVTYQHTPGGITFLHTETEPEFEGHGVASRLAAAVLDDARARGLRVTALCPFISSYIERHPAYADLREPSP